MYACPQNPCLLSQELPSHARDIPTSATCVGLVGLDCCLMPGLRYLMHQIADSAATSRRPPSGRPMARPRGVFSSAAVSWLGMIGNGGDGGLGGAEGDASAPSSTSTVPLLGHEVLVTQFLLLTTCSISVELMIVVRQLEPIHIAHDRSGRDARRGSIFKREVVGQEAHILLIEKAVRLPISTGKTHARLVIAIVLDGKVSLEVEIR